MDTTTELLTDERGLPVSLAARLGFWIERRGDVDVIVWVDGGCRPATGAEAAMWALLNVR